MGEIALVEDWPGDEAQKDHHERLHRADGGELEGTALAQGGVLVVPLVGAIARHDTWPQDSKSAPSIFVGTGTG